MSWIVDWLSAKKFYIILSVFSTLIVLLIILHMLFPDKIIDTITIALIIIGIFPWFVPQLRMLEFSGVKLEFRDLQKATEKMEKVGLVAEEEAPVSDPFIISSARGEDPALALAWVRIEIEKRLRKIAKVTGIDVERLSISRMMRLLGEREIFTHQEVESIMYLTKVLNKAIHGDEVDKRAADWAMDEGQMIIRALDDRYSSITNLSGNSAV